MNFYIYISTNLPNGVISSLPPEREKDTHIKGVLYHTDNNNNKKETNFLMSK
jgi:hypothetical protein